MRRLSGPVPGQKPDLQGLRGFSLDDATEPAFETNRRPLKIRKRSRQITPEANPQPTQQDEPKSTRQVVEYRRPLDSSAFYAIPEARWEGLKAKGDKATMRKYTHIGRIMEGDGQKAAPPCTGCAKSHEECWVYEETLRREQKLGSNQCARCRYKQQSCSLAKVVDTEQSAEPEAGRWVSREEYEVLEQKCNQLQKDMDQLRAETASRLASLEKLGQRNHEG